MVLTKPSPAVSVEIECLKNGDNMSQNMFLLAYKKWEGGAIKESTHLD